MKLINHDIWLWEVVVSGKSIAQEFIKLNRLQEVVLELRDKLCLCNRVGTCDTCKEINKTFGEILEKEVKA